MADNASSSAELKPEGSVPVTQDQLQALMNEIKRLKTENEEFKRRQKPLTFSVSDRGAISIHGLSKNPQTLYKAQWEKILDRADDLRKFMAENKDRLD